MHTLTCLDVHQLLHRHDASCYADGRLPTPRAATPKHTASTPPPAQRVPRCHLTDLATDTCAHCLGHTSPAEKAAAEQAQRRAARSHPTPAVHPGTCANCRHPYGPATPLWRTPLGAVTSCCADIR